MDRIVKFVERSAHCATKCSEYKGLFYAVWIVVAALILVFAKQLATLFVIISCAFYLLATADECKHSCGSLILFWLRPCLVIALLMYCLSFGVLPRNITNGPLAYGIGCLALTFFWGLSAAIAEYDVAKMAGEIINTTTTILFVVVNALVWWLNQAVKTSIIDWHDLISATNLILLPIVASGYLAMLFVDGVEYYKKKHPVKESTPRKTDIPDESAKCGAASTGARYGGCEKQRISRTHNDTLT